MSVQEWEAFSEKRIRTRNGDTTRAWLDVFGRNVTLTAGLPAGPSLRSLDEAISGFLAAKARMGR